MKHLFAMFGLLMAASVNAAPVGSAFTYQGQLNKDGGPVNAPQDFAFGLYDASQAGAQIGTTVTLAAVPVEKGLFTVSLDFGPQAFGADARFLQIQVKPTGEATYASLSPRVAITPAPVALTALTAGTAAVANAVAPGAVGSQSLKTGSVLGTHLAQEMFAVHHAVASFDQRVHVVPTLMNFDKVVHTSPAYTGNSDWVKVNHAGLYRIELCLALSEQFSAIAYHITINGSSSAIFGDQWSSAPQDSLMTGLHYVTLNAGDEIAIRVLPGAGFVTVKGSSTANSTYLSIMKVK